MHQPGHTEQELVCVPVRIEFLFFQNLSFNHFNHRPRQNLRTREAVRAISALSSNHACETCMTDCIRLLTDIPTPFLYLSIIVSRSATRMGKLWFPLWSCLLSSHDIPQHWQFPFGCYNRWQRHPMSEARSHGTFFSRTNWRQSCKSRDDFISYSCTFGGRDTD